MLDCAIVPLVDWILRNLTVVNTCLIRRVMLVGEAYSKLKCSKWLFRPRSYWSGQCSWLFIVSSWPSSYGHAIIQRSSKNFNNMDCCSSLQFSYGFWSCVYMHDYSVASCLLASILPRSEILMYRRVEVDGMGYSRDKEARGNSDMRERNSRSFELSQNKRGRPNGMQRFCLVFVHSCLSIKP